MNKHQPPPLRMKVDRGSLVPASAWDSERLNSYRVGSTVNVRFTADRARPLERKYRAILGKIVKECETPWSNAETAHQALKLACGYVNVGKTTTGRFMQWPRSLVDFDDLEMEDYFEKAMTLLQELTGVDIETMQRESANVGHDDDDVDPETGEILNPNPGASSSPLPADDEPPHSSSSQPADMSPPVSAGTLSNLGDDVRSPPGEGSVEPLTSPAPVDVAAEPSNPSGELPPIPESELPVLRRFAADVLNMAAQSSTSGDLMSKVIRNWFNNQLVSLGESGRAAAKSIHGSVKAIMNNDVSAESAKEYHAEMLLCAVSELDVKK